MRGFIYGSHISDLGNLFASGVVLHCRESGKKEWGGWERICRGSILTTALGDSPGLSSNFSSSRFLCLISLVLLSSGLRLWLLMLQVLCCPVWYIVFCQIAQAQCVLYSLCTSWSTFSWQALLMLVLHFTQDIGFLSSGNSLHVTSILIPSPFEEKRIPHPLSLPTLQYPSVQDNWELHKITVLVSRGCCNKLTQTLAQNKLITF